MNGDGLRNVTSAVAAAAVIRALHRNSAGGCFDDVFTVGRGAPSPLTQSCAHGRGTAGKLRNAHLLGCVGHVAAAVLASEHASVTAVEALTTQADSDWTQFAVSVCRDTQPRGSPLAVLARYRSVPNTFADNATVAAWVTRSLDAVPSRLALAADGTTRPLKDRESAVPTLIHVPRCLFPALFHAANGLFTCGAPMQLVSLAARGVIDGINMLARTHRELMMERCERPQPQGRGGSEANSSSNY